MKKNQSYLSGVCKIIRKIKVKEGKNGEKSESEKMREDLISNLRNQYRYESEELYHLKRLLEKWDFDEEFYGIVCSVFRDGVTIDAVYRTLNLKDDGQTLVLLSFIAGHGKKGQLVNILTGRNKAGKLWAKSHVTFKPLLF